MEVNAVVLVTQTPNEVYGRKRLRQYGGVGSSCDAPSTDVDEDVVEQQVDEHTKQHRHHCLVRMPYDTQYIRQTMCQMRDDVTVDDNHHISLGVG